jgi:hypothetical protein
MKNSEIKEFIYRDYNLRRNTKIHKIDIDKMEFTIRIGSCLADIAFGKSLTREIKLRSLGI